jgi:hypothetical protein
LPARRFLSMLIKTERQQAIRFQDAIGEIVDQYLKEGMCPSKPSKRF